MLLPKAEAGGPRYESGKSKPTADVGLTVKSQCARPTVAGERA